MKGITYDMYYSFIKMGSNKKYYEYIDELDKNEVYEGLLGYGMFSEKLPPIFSSENFMEYCNNENLDLFQDNRKKEHTYVHYQNIRNINIPRPIGIPHPMAYYELCKEIEGNWGNIQKHFRKYTSHQFKISRVHIRKFKNKKNIFKMNYGERKDTRIDIMIDKKYIIKADISKCFQSIYTHSIPWALVGKEEAKVNRNQTNRWYNRIDKKTINIKDNETHGLLIGPHASNILSEIILCVVDDNLYKKGWEFIRNIDDYECYVNSELDANKFLIDLQEELIKFDLSLNHKKTKVEKLPKEIDSPWIRKLNILSLIIQSNVKNIIDYKLCKYYFDTVLDFVKEEDDNFAILNYAIKILDKLKLSNNAKMYEARFIMHLSLIYPYIIPLLDEYILKNIDIEFIEMISNKIYNTYKEQRIYEALIYSIYFAIKYNFNILEIDVDFIKDTEDCILNLITYLYYYKIDKNGEECNKLKEYALSFRNIKDIESMWLFIYEILSENELKKLKNKLNNKEKNQKNDWIKMKEKTVSFLNSKINDLL